LILWKSLREGIFCSVAWSNTCRIFSSAVQNPLLQMRLGTETMRLDLAPLCLL